MRGCGANDPEAVAEPPQANRQPAKLSRIAHEIETRVGVVAERDGGRHAGDDLVVVKLGQLALRALEQLEEHRALRRAEGLIELDEASRERIDVLRPGLKAIGRFRINRNPAQRERMGVLSLTERAIQLAV